MGTINRGNDAEGLLDLASRVAGYEAGVIDDKDGVEDFQCVFMAGTQPTPPCLSAVF